MKERILKIMQSQQMTQRDFAAALGISPSSLSSIFNGHTSPTNNTVQAIHRRFPEISIAWLMFGEGEMMAVKADTDAPTDKQDESVRLTGSQEPVMVSTDAGSSIESPVADSNIPGQVIIRETVKYVDKPQRRITEIRVFYDDGTFDTFS